MEPIQPPGFQKLQPPKKQPNVNWHEYARKALLHEIYQQVIKDLRQTQHMFKQKGQ